jgi:putative Mg2+ transporter-C (MgtC) family protein
LFDERYPHVAQRRVSQPTSLLLVVRHDLRMHHEQWVIVLRVLTAFGLTFALGFERQIRGSAAGDRTFSLIGVATAVIGVLSAQGALTLLSGAVTGVGFIGAGLLFRQTDQQFGVVHGVTTAAAILATAGIGAAAGEGQLWLALIATVLVILILELRYIPGLRVLDANRWKHLFQDDDDHEHVHVNQIIEQQVVEHQVVEQRDAPAAERRTGSAAGDGRS